MQSQLITKSSNYQLRATALNAKTHMILVIHQASLIQDHLTHARALALSQQPQMRIDLQFTKIKAIKLGHGMICFLQLKIQMLWR
jgi:hypothetical protein